MGTFSSSGSLEGNDLVIDGMTEIVNVLWEIISYKNVKQTLKLKYHHEQI